MQRFRGAPVTRSHGVILDDETLDKWLSRFDVFRIDADVADFRIGHSDQLSLIGRVRENLLIAGHAGVKDDFAYRFAFGAETTPLESPSVCQCQNSFHRSIERGALLV